MAASTQCTFELPVETVDELRTLLADSGETDPAAMDRFVSLAIQDRIFEEAARQAKAATAHLNEEELGELVDEAIVWARAQK
jgi:hypothetical protein